MSKWHTPIPPPTPSTRFGKESLRSSLRWAVSGGTGLRSSGLSVRFMEGLPEGKMSNRDYALLYAAPEVGGQEGVGPARLS